MKQKITKMFLACLMIIPVFTSVFAISSEDLMARLDGIIADVDAMKDEYNDILETYPDVIDSLSSENKAKAEDLANNLLADDVEDTVKAIKAELKASTVQDADKVLAAIEDLQADAEKLIEDNKDVVEEVKTGYSDMSTTEVQQVIEKVKDVVESLGMEVDTTDTYNKLMKILEDAHGIALDINTKLRAIIRDNVATFESALTKELIKEVLTEVKAKDQEAVIDTLIKALDNADGGAQVKAWLKEVKVDAKELKAKLMELKNLSEQDLLMFTDTQKTAVSNKLKKIEKDYIDFAKVVIDDSAENYMKVVINLGYNEPVDKMIEYANEALDYYAEYKDTVKDLANKETMISKLPEDMKDLAEKAGLMVALGFVDTSDYNKEYVTNNFQTQIDNMTEFIAEEFVDYLDHIDSVMKGEIADELSLNNSASTTQKNIIAINSARFTTLDNIKALKTRIFTELLADQAETKAEISKVMPYVYDIYNENILSTIETIMSLENEKKDKEYEFNSGRLMLLTDSFMAKDKIAKTLGIPTANMNVVTYKGLANNKIKTGSSMTITLSENVFGTYQYAVLGDVYADGVINSRDYMAIKNQIMGDDELKTINKMAADTYRDNSISSRDYMVIKNYIMDDKEISL